MADAARQRARKASRAAQTAQPDRDDRRPGEPEVPAVTPSSSGPPRVLPGRPPDPTVQALRRESSPLRRLLRVLGPGLITGASDDDPSGIGTYAQAGAAFGFATLWTTVLMLPMMTAVQYMCAKIGLVSGRGLAGVLRQHYTRRLLYPAVLALVVANTANAGADIGAIAAAINLLIPVPPILLVVPVAAAILALQVWGSYALIARVFKWLTLALLAYIAAAFLARPDLGAVVRGSLIPTIRLDAQFLALLVALLGTTISPYLFFWQASQEVEEQIDMGRTQLWQRRGASDTELEYKTWDVSAGMILSELVAYFTILATGATLFQAGKTQISSATEAALALRPIAGDSATVLLAVGLIGAGVLAVPILTGAGAYAVSEAFGWRFGLDAPPHRARQFYAVIAASTVVGMAINFLGVNPISALVLTAVLNGLLAPPLLVLILLVANDRRVMGERVNGRLLNAVGILTAGLMGIAALALVLTSVTGLG